MDLKQLEAFVAIARLGSFAAAANHLCITQPAISIRISNLEGQIRSKLFDRVGKNVALTPTGHEILLHAGRIVSDAQVFRRAFGTPKFLADRIRIGSTDSFLRSSLPPIIARFQKLHPSLDLSVGDSTLIWSQLLSGEIDAGFHANSAPHFALRSVPLFDSDLIWVGKPGAVPFEAELTLSQLAEYQIFTPRQGSIAYSAVADLFRVAGIDQARVCGVNSVEAVVRFTEAGLGVGVMARKVAQEGIARGSLDELAPSPKLPSIRYVVSHRIESLSDAGRVLTDIASMS